MMFQKYIWMEVNGMKIQKKEVWPKHLDGGERKN